MGQSPALMDSGTDDTPQQHVSLTIKSGWPHQHFEEELYSHQHVLVSDRFSSAIAGPRNLIKSKK